MLAHCPLSKNRSAALTQYLASPELPSNDVYSGILTGIKSVAVPVRLSRKEAVGVVKMLQSWRGDRERERVPSISPVRLLTLLDCSQLYRISCSWSDSSLRMGIHANLRGLWVAVFLINRNVSLHICIQHLSPEPGSPHLT